jgi:pyrimidine operon attenuation protein/uracil phosphoribosyltransferase
MKILNERQMEQKITRLAIEILENNLEEDMLIFAGINTKGMDFARLLHRQIQSMSDKKMELTQVRINPAAPLSEPVRIGLPLESLQDRTIILTDDVANTGRTLFYACRPLLDTLPRRLEVAVLIDRQHKLFPIRADYVGLSLATTLKENIEVVLNGSGEEAAVYLD